MDSFAPLLYVLVGALVVLLCLQLWQRARRRALLRSNEFNVRLIDALPPPAREWGGITPLTPRELQVARLIASGWQNAEVAHELGISKHTVGEHLKHIYRKLNIRSRLELVQALEEMEQEDTDQ